MYSNFLENKFGHDFSNKYFTGHDCFCFGVINLTPDSFSEDTLLYCDAELQLKKINELVALGVDVLDIGGESTRPGAEAVCTEEEYARLEPFLLAYRATLALSLDTRNPELIRKVFLSKTISKKIKFINDVSGMQNEFFFGSLCSILPAGNEIYCNAF